MCRNHLTGNDLWSSNPVVIFPAEFASAADESGDK
jgi:hypothetical protein